MKIFFTLFLISLSAITFSQPSIGWQNTYGGTANDINPVMVSTPDNGILIAGSSQSDDIDIGENHGYYDIWVIKLDASGNKVWQKSYGGSQGDFVNAIIQSNDGNFILLGSSLSSNGDLTENKGLADLWIFKIDGSGSLLWQKTYGGSDNDEGFGIYEIADAHLLIIGNTESADGDISSTHGLTDIWLLNLNDDGSLNWQRTYGGTKDDYGCSVTEIESGQLIIAGYSYSNDGDIISHYESTDKCDYIALKANGSGDLLWVENYGGNENDHLTGMFNSSDGLLLYGTSDSDNGNITGSHGLLDGWIIKINYEGGVLWQKSLGGTGNDYLSSIVQNSDNYLYAVGSTFSANGDISINKGESDCWLMKMDPNGPLQWSLTLGGAMTELSNSLLITNDEDLMLGACSYSSDGDINENLGLYDYWIVKTTSIAGFCENETFQNFINLWPNPADVYISVSFQNFTNPFNLSICDINGREVYKIKIQNASIETIDISSFPAGIYFLKTSNSQENFYKKLIIY